MNPNDIIALISTLRGKAYRFIQRELDAHGMKGLAPSHGAILSALFRSEEIAMSDLATAIERDRSTVTTLVQKLVDYGYVTRSRDASDWRVTYVSLTPAGRALEPRFRAISRALIARTYRGFKSEEKSALMGYLGRIRENWEGR